MNRNEKRPAADSSGGRGADGNHNSQPNSTIPSKPDKPSLIVRVWPDAEPITFTGRPAQTLALLVTKGPLGFTSGEASPLGWARRTSAYVQKLREAGVPILTTWETTHDARVGRYTLAGPVVVLSWGVSS